MMGISWRLVNVVSQLLEREEREAVLGDLVEAGESARQVLLDVLGLVIRRHVIVWKNWRSWLAEQIIDPTVLKVTGRTVGTGFSLLLWHIFLLAGWSWTGGILTGSVSRRTVWASAALACIPCVFCLAWFPVESLSRLCLLLCVLPAIWGVRRGCESLASS